MTTFEMQFPPGELVRYVRESYDTRLDETANHVVSSIQETAKLYERLIGHVADLAASSAPSKAEAKPEELCAAAALGMLRILRQYSLEKKTQ